MAETKKKQPKKPTGNEIAYDEAHGDLQALKKAGVSIPRAVQLAHASGVQHPAIGKGKSKVSVTGKNPSAGYAAAVSGSDKGTGVSSDPSDPAQYAADVLVQAGLPDTASNEKLLEDQMTVEGMPGSEDNPLATTEKAPGSSSVNSAGVQEYPSLFEGASAEAQTLKQPNMASIYKALLSGNATPNQYATGLASSQYEGSNPQANSAYALSFLKDSGEPESAFPAGIASSGGSGSTYDSGLASDTLAQAMGTNLFSGLGSGTIPSLGTQMADTSLQQALSGLSDTSAAQTLQANTANAPGSPDQTPSQAQQTSVSPASQYQQALAALLPNIRPGAAANG